MRKFSEQKVGRTDVVLGWASRIMGLTRVLGGIFVFALLQNPVQAAQSVTLAWSPSPNTTVVGCNVYYGVASRTYTSMVDAGNATNATISGLTEGQTYYFALTAYNSLGLESVFSSEISYAVPASDNLPTIALTSPLDGGSYTAPAAFNLAASVTANGYAITTVQFYNGTILLGEATSAPYNWTWSNVSAGSYNLTARAVYDAGSTVDSSPANVTVINLPPTVALTFEATSGTITAPFVASGGTVYQTTETTLASSGRAAYSFAIVDAGDYLVTANVDATNDGANSFFVNIDAEPTDPYMVWHIPVTTGLESRTVSWQGNGTWDNSEFVPKVFTLVAGTHELIVRGREGNTKLGTITISPATNSTPPIVALTSPLDGASYTAPAAFDLAASVTANGHAITTVQFYNGTNLLGEATSAPYNWACSHVGAGSYSLTARAVYDAGSTVDSSPANVTVTNPPPTIALTSPLDGASYTAPAAINLAASVTANGHTITTATVQFYNGTTLLGEVTSAPYNWTWNNVSAGSYSLTARAVYGAGSTVDSSPANVTVTNPPPTIALTSPLDGGSYTAPAAINLAASVTANGHTITTATVQFYNGTTLLGEVTSAPYNWTWNNVSAGSYSLTARAVYGAGSTVDSSPVNINVAGLPAPWQTADIGSVDVVGNASMSDGIYTVEGAGNLSGTADNFRFVYQPLSGDGEIKVRLNSVEDTGTSGRIGVMIRESLTSGSEYAFMGILPDGTFRWQRRSRTGGWTWSTTSTIGTPPDVWARLVRTGDTLYGYESTDGTNWTQVNSRSITMATDIYVGLAVASGNSNTLNTATFTDVTVVP